jgi:hypothetical protein
MDGVAGGEGSVRTFVCARSSQTVVKKRDIGSDCNESFLHSPVKSTQFDEGKKSHDYY